VDPNEIIRKKLDIRKISSPPILAWIGTGRHKLHDESIGRNLLAELFKELGYKNGVEIGVDRGYYSDVLLSKNPDLHLTGVDSWVGDKAETHFRDAKQRLSKHGDRIELMKMRSLDAVKVFPWNSLDFVYLDSNRSFNDISLDLINWGRRVRQGGMIAGRGYCHLFETGVVRAVDAYTYSHNIRNWYITRDIEPNYLWIKHWESK